MSYTGVPKHIPISVGTTLTRVKFNGVSVTIYVENNHATQDLLFNFDGNATDFITLNAGESWQEEAAAQEIWIKGSGAATTGNLTVGV